MTQDELEALLGRDLTSEEVDNLALYLNIASERLQSLICSTFLTSDSSDEEPETRKYESRAGYSTVFTDIFNAVTQVEVDGIVATDYEVRQFDNLNGTWFNSLVFDRRFYKNQLVEVTGDFGFDTMPDDLQLLWAKLFDSVSYEQNTDSSVESQRIDDASVTFKKDGTSQERFYQDNKSVIDRYSLCSIGNIRHGAVWRHC